MGKIQQCVVVQLEQINNAACNAPLEPTQKWQQVWDQTSVKSKEAQRPREIEDACATVQRQLTLSLLFDSGRLFTYGMHHHNTHPTVSRNATSTCSSI